MTQKKQNEQEFMNNFISVYKEHTALWKIKSPEYSNKFMKEKGYDALVEIYKKYNFENVTKDTVKKKISSMRASFRREHKKFKTLKSGIGGEEVEEPSLWYYNLLLFTADDEEPRDTISNEGSDDNGETEEASRNAAPKRKAQKNATSASTRTLDENKEKLLKKAYEALSNADEYDAFAVTVAAKLRKLSEEQRLYCENIINTALYKAALNKLSENTTLVTSSSYEEKAPASRRSLTTFNINSLMNRENTTSTQNSSFITLSSALNPQASCSANYQENRSIVYGQNDPQNNNLLYHNTGSIPSADINSQTNSIFSPSTDNVQNYVKEFNPNN